MPAAPAATSRFGVPHVQLLRAVFAAIAALMITFSPDHSAFVGLAVFSGFAIATGLVWGLSAWLVQPVGRRGMPILLGSINLLAGMAAAVTVWRSTALFFALVIAWAIVTGLIEAVWAIRALRQARRLETSEPARFESPTVERTDARDGLVIGVLTLVLAAGLLITPAGYALDYYIPEAGASFTLTGITIAVGIFGGYAAIVAVYLGIAGFSPRRAVTADDTGDAGHSDDAAATDDAGTDTAAAPTKRETV